MPSIRDDFQPNAKATELVEALESLKAKAAPKRKGKDTYDAERIAKDLKRIIRDTRVRTKTDVYQNQGIRKEWPLPRQTVDPRDTISRSSVKRRAKRNDAKRKADIAKAAVAAERMYRSRPQWARPTWAE